MSFIDNLKSEAGPSDIFQAHMWKEIDAFSLDVVGIVWNFRLSVLILNILVSVFLLI